MSNEDSLVNKLRLVKHLLKEDIWNQGAYFAEKDGNLCMCAHGAAQVVSNPEVKKVFVSQNFTGAAERRRDDSALRRAAGACIRAAGAGIRAASATTAARAALAAACAFAAWSNREFWVKNNAIFNKVNYGNLDIHYIFGLVGLTVSFNDSKDTTFTMIQNKLDQAISLAQEFGL